MKKTIIILLSFLCLTHSTIHAQNSILDNYINEGLESNIVLQQKNVSLNNALLVFKQARNLYIPTLDFQGLYTTAQGGRNIQLPVGDMMNPVYSTLNQFMGQNAFPMIENQEINFLPKNYYDARFRVSVPIVNTDIIHNQRIQNKKMLLQENEVEIYKRELIKEIKTTYFNYLSASKVTEIHRASIELANEGKRTNEKLIEAGKGLHAYVLRSETEIAQANAKLTAALLQQQSIQKYFNALLNRNADDLIELMDNETIIPFIQATSLSTENREELKSMDYMISLREDVIRMNKQYFIPKLNGFADLGSQAEKMRFDNKSTYFMVGLQLNIPIYNGNRNNLKIKEAKNEIEIAKLQKEYTKQQLEVAITASYNDFLTAKANYESALQQLEMAETYFRLIEKGYTAGVNTFIETVDARTQLTSAQLASTINYYQMLISLAKLERETATFEIN